MTWTNPDVGSENKIAASDLKAAYWTTLHTGCVLQLEMKGGASSRYTGFKSKDLNTFKDHFKTHYKIDLGKGEVASTGQSWGHLSLTSHSIVMSGTGSAESKTVLELPMSDVSQCAVPQNEEIEIQFVEDNTMNKVDTVVSMRMYVPSGAKVSGLSAKENDDDEVLDDVAELQKEIIDRCGLGANTGESIVEFEDKVGNFLTPRGRYKIELYVYISFLSRFLSRNARARRTSTDSRKKCVFEEKRTILHFSTSISRNYFFYLAKKMRTLL